MKSTLALSQLPSFSGLARLGLHHFRNYEQTHLDITAPVVVITGDNGVGKTNILEAISLFTPGRGLRSGKLTDMVNVHTKSPWVVSMDLMCDDQTIPFGSALEYTQSGGEKRTIRINHTPVKAQSALSEWINVVWLIPAMARLFQESGSIRRKFIDRMVVTLDPGHSERLNRYEHYLRERSTLLREGRGDNTWLTTIEQKLAEDGIALTLARAHLVRQITESQPQDNASPFPRFFAQMRGDVETWCRELPAIEAEDRLRDHLKQSRPSDAQTGGAAHGPHRGDLHVDHLGKHMRAELCSTGEQKMLLLAMTLAFTHILDRHRDRTTLLLLDDVAAHLDQDHRTYLFQELQNTIDRSALLQLWMTGTNAADFGTLGQNTQLIEL